MTNKTALPTYTDHASDSRHVFATDYLTANCTSISLSFNSKGPQQTVTMSQMRAIDIEGGKGPASALFINKNTPRPTAHGNQALIKVKAFGLNRMDILQREGKYIVPPQAPSILGVEFSGGRYLSRPVHRTRLTSVNQLAQQKGSNTSKATGRRNC